MHTILEKMIMNTTFTKVIVRSSGVATRFRSNTKLLLKRLSMFLEKTSYNLNSACKALSESTWRRPHFSKVITLLEKWA